MTRADIEQKAIERFPIPYDNPRNHTQVTINAVAFEKQQAYIEGALMAQRSTLITYHTYLRQNKRIKVDFDQTTDVYRMVDNFLSSK